MVTTHPSIRFRLVGADEDQGNVRFEDLRTFFNKLHDCLSRTEAAVSHEHKIRYRISDLRNSSAGATLEAVPPKKGVDRRSEVVGLFKQTVFNLEAGTPIDQRFTFEDLKKFRDLIAPLRKTKEVWIEGNLVTSQYTANIDKILGSTVHSRGSVSGRLERLNVHNKSVFVLYLPLPGVQVECYFPDEIFEQVREGVRRTVTVSGDLYYLPDKAFPSKVHVQTIEIHPLDEELPKLGNLRGIFKGGTGGKSAVEFVRDIRNEQRN